MVIVYRDSWYNKYWKEDETLEFNEWFNSYYGFDDHEGEDECEYEEYWIRRAFALMGWLAREKNDRVS